MPTTIFAGNLDRDVRVVDIEDLFMDYRREISNINLKDGYAFITFDYGRDADDAIRRLNQKRVYGRPINLETSTSRQNDDGRFGRGGRGGFDRGGRGTYNGGQRKRTYRTVFALVVKNLSTECTWIDLADLVRDKVGIRITFADANKIVPREGIISFASAEDCKLSMEKINGETLRGRKIECSYEYPEALERDWKGDVNNDKPYYKNAKDKVSIDLGADKKSRDDYRRRTSVRSRSGSRNNRSRSPRGRSRSPKRERRSRSPQNKRQTRSSERSRSPQNNRRGDQSQNSRRSRSPQNRRRSPSPQNRRRSASPSPNRRRSRSTSRRRDNNRRSPSPRRRSRSRRRTRSVSRDRSGSRKRNDRSSSGSIR